MVKWWIVVRGSWLEKTGNELRLAPKVRQGNAPPLSRRRLIALKASEKKPSLRGARAAEGGPGNEAISFN